MRIEEDVKLDFDDVLIRPKRSLLKSREDVILTREYRFKYSEKTWNGVPILAANMDKIGTFEVHEVLQRYGLGTVFHKHYTIDEWESRAKDFNNQFGIVSIGSSDNDLQKLAKIYKILPTKPNFICIDVANGYGEYFSDFVSSVREDFPDITIMAGNVVTGEMTEQLILSGADIVKVGIGSGSVCTTRLKTGVGYPQLSAVIECADAAHGMGGLIIADGGCRTPADVAKAFGAGADFVMLGGMFAGHNETGRDYYGMSSSYAQLKRYGELKNYRASEGKIVSVENRGPLEVTVKEILGGLRSTCTYVGAPSLKQLSKCTTFIKVSRTHNSVFE